MSGILGELNVISIGVGYTLPFQLFAASWIDAERLSASMNGLTLPGLNFRPVHFQPYYALFKGQMIHGVQVYITDYEKACLTMVQFYFLQECQKGWPDKKIFELADKQRISMFDKVCGTDKIRKEFTRTHSAAEIEKIWMKDVDAFREKSSPYLLY